MLTMLMEGQVLAFNFKGGWRGGGEFPALKGVARKVLPFRGADTNMTFGQLFMSHDFSMTMFIFQIFQSQWSPGLGSHHHAPYH